MISRDTRIRIARPTDDLERIVRMYEAGLGLERLGSFEDHDGFDGVILGAAEGGWHIEFTTARGVRAGGAPSAEHLLVVYLPERCEWESAGERMLAAGFERVRSQNPYWDREGRTFRDPDGYRVVLQCAEWTR
jgi:catechol 2,3-dioxygenase-like lactoylglutathione lyase family enzyme